MLPFFRQSPLLYRFFMPSSRPPKNEIFQWTAKYWSFSSLTLSCLLIVIKFLVQISNLNSYLWHRKTSKHVYQLFLSLNIQICLFLCKIIAISLKKSHLSLSQQPLLQNSGLVKTPTPSAHFWKFGTRFEKQKKEGADHVGIPSPLFSYFLLHKSRYICTCVEVSY